MYKSLVLLCVVYSVVEARPKWQFLPPKPGYVPVYIRSGDTPLEEINLELAEAFHAVHAGRSAGKQLEADSDLDTVNIPEGSVDVPETSESLIDRRPYEKKLSEKKKKATGIEKPERR